MLNHHFHYESHLYLNFFHHIFCFDSVLILFCDYMLFLDVIAIHEPQFVEQGIDLEIRKQWIDSHTNGIKQRCFLMFLR